MVDAKEHNKKQLLNRLEYPNEGVNTRDIAQGVAWLIKALPTSTRTITLTEAEKLELELVVAKACSQWLDCIDRGKPTWDTLPPVYQKAYRNQAQAALTAALEWINGRKHGF